MVWTLSVVTSARWIMSFVIVIVDHTKVWRPLGVGCRDTKGMFLVCVCVCVCVCAASLLEQWFVVILRAERKISTAEDERSPLELRR